jgi:peptidyl-Asp metalloendopeptidase
MRVFVFIVIVMTILTIFFPGVYATAEQQGNLIPLFLDYTDSLTEEQQHFLLIRKTHPSAEETRVATANADFLEHSTEALLNLFPDANYVFQLDYIESENNGDFGWFGTVTNDLGNTFDGGARLSTRADNGMVGFVWVGEEVFTIRRLGGGVNVIIRVDQSQFPPDAPPVEIMPQTGQSLLPVERMNQVSSTRSGTSIPTGCAAQPALHTINVLFAFTDRVLEDMEDEVAFMQGAINLTNSANARSGVNVRLVKTGSTATDYVERGSIITDLALLQGREDDSMVNIHIIRESARADLVILITKSSDFCGRAWTLADKDPDTGFGVVNDACAIANISFPHEVGHLKGSQHDVFATTLNRPFPYGHGYLRANLFELRLRSVMASTRAGATRIPVWSNPDIMIEGKPFGVADEQDNKRAFNESAFYMSKLRSGRCAPIPKEAIVSNPDWKIQEDCVLTHSDEAGEKVHVESDATLTMDPNVCLGVDLTNHNIRLASTAKINVKDGGKIYSTGA